MGTKLVYLKEGMEGGFVWETKSTEGKLQTFFTNDSGFGLWEEFSNGTAQQIRNIQSFSLAGKTLKKAMMTIKRRLTEKQKLIKENDEYLEFVNAIAN